jgi:cytochrome oxidase assembly protein ShyY1
LARAVAGLVVVLAGSSLAITAGVWQYGRYTERADALRAFEIASSLPVVELELVTTATDDEPPSDAVWRTVRVDGEFDPESVVVLRNRPVGGTAAWQYLAWFSTEDGSLLVNTGWATQPGPNADAVYPDLPQGTVTIEVILREWEDDDGRRDSGATRIAPAQVRPPQSSSYPVYGMLRHSCEDVCAAAEGVDEVPLPQLSTGPHLSYAWQWWVFAGLIPVGAVILMRRDPDGGPDPTRANASPDTSDPIRPVTPRRRWAPLRPARARTELSDEDVEDAL